MIFLNKLLVEHLFVLGAKTPMEVPVELKRLVDGIFADTHWRSPRFKRHLRLRVWLRFCSIGLMRWRSKLSTTSTVVVVTRRMVHSNVRSWSAFTCRTTGTEASRRLSLAKAFRQLPTTAARYRAGVLGREQVGCLATACASDRYGRLVVKSEADSQHH